MDFELLKIFGQIAGIGGLALGTFLILFREVIRKKIFPRLTKSQAYRLLKLMVVLIWSIGAIGIISWIYVKNLNQKNSINEKISALTDPVKEVDVVKTNASNVRISRILEGKAEDISSKVFDIIIENPTNKQIILTNFIVKWRYYHGFLASIAEGAVLKPVAEYIIELPIDTDDEEKKSKTIPVYPIIAIPPSNESGPSLTNIRIQLHYRFTGRLNYHPSSDWNIFFDISLTNNKGGKLEIFNNKSWHY